MHEPYDPRAMPDLEVADTEPTGPPQGVLPKFHGTAMVRGVVVEGVSVSYC
jgi:hypothetical protein